MGLRALKINIRRQQFVHSTNDTVQMGGKTFAVAIIPLSTSTNSGSVRGLISRGHDETLLLLALDGARAGVRIVYDLDKNAPDLACMVGTL